MGPDNNIRKYSVWGKNRIARADYNEENMSISIGTTNTLLGFVSVEENNIHKKPSEPISRRSQSSLPAFSFVQPLVLPVHQPKLEQKKLVADELSIQQDKGRN